MFLDKEIGRKQEKHKTKLIPTRAYTQKDERWHAAGLAHVASDLERNPLGQRTWSQPLPSGQTSFDIQTALLVSYWHTPVFFWARGNAFLDLFERKY